MATKLYFSRGAPLHWIAEDEGVLVMWPAEDNGWEHRRPYRGHRRGLEEVQAYNAHGTGWPGLEAKSRLSPGESTHVQFRCSAAVRLAVLSRAETEGLTEREAWEAAGRAWADGD